MNVLMTPSSIFFIEGPSCCCLSPEPRPRDCGQVAKRQLAETHHRQEDNAGQYGSYSSGKAHPRWG